MYGNALIGQGVLILVGFYFSFEILIKNSTPHFDPPLENLLFQRNTVLRTDYIAHHQPRQHTTRQRYHMYITRYATHYQTKVSHVYNKIRNTLPDNKHLLTYKGITCI